MFGVKKILSLSFIIAHVVLHAQINVQVHQDSLFNQSTIQFSSFNHYASNKFNNALMDKFIFGGFIDEELKNENYNRLKNANNLGGEFEQTIISYSPNIHPMKKDKYGLILSFSDNHFVSGNLSKDIFGLTFFGNSQYVGDTLDLSFASIKYQHYQKLGFGLYDISTGSSVRISYVIGSKGFDFYTGDSYFLTHEPIDTLELNLLGEGFSTKQFSPYMAFQGNGISLDINYNFFFENKKGNRQILNLKVNNVGGIFWNKNSSIYTVDSTSYFTGFDVKDFIGKDSLTEQWNFEDTIGIAKKTGRFGEALPIEIEIQKLADLNGNKLQLIAGFKAIITTAYKPYFYAGVYYKPINQLLINSYLSYGGYAHFRLGLMLNYQFKNAGSVSLGTADLIGNISKQFGFGRSLIFSGTFKL